MQNFADENRPQPTNFNRPPRIQLLSLPAEEIDIPAPPEQPNVPEQSLFVSIMPVLGIGVMAMFYVFRAATADSGSAYFAIPLMALAAFTIGGTVLAQRWRRKDHARRGHDNTINYIRLLEKKRARLQAAHNAQIAILETSFPKPQDGLRWALARDTWLWEHRPTDPDFAAFRLGLGRIQSQITIKTPDPDLDSDELDRAMQLADSYRFLHDAPVAISLQQNYSLGFCGKRTLVLQNIRSVICQLAITHAPQDLHVHLIAPQAHLDSWRWLEWLPHASRNHQGGTADLLAFETGNIRNLLGYLSQTIDARKERSETINSPHLLLIIDDPQLAESESIFTTILHEGGQIGASALCIVNTYENIPGDCNAIVEVDGSGRFRYAGTGPQGTEITGSALDQLSLQDAEHITRALSSVIMRESGAAGRIPKEVNILDLYGARYVEDLHDKIKARWQRPIPDGILPFAVPIGRESLALDTYIMLDEDHHGPHGVLAGTTGSGKSGLLQTLVCAMALEHDPRLATFLLIDFKGGSTFNVFGNLPHTVGTVTNLDVVLVERTLEAIKAETYTRQQFLKTINVRDITQYHRYFAKLQDTSYQPLPHLFIIVDEFAQLSKEMPEFMRELVRTVQVGRSLGLHLILGTQSPMDVITDEMNANLQFRICLRVQNIEASRSMLRRPDAAYLPAGWPGRGYFQVGERGMFKQFQAAYAGNDYIPVDQQETQVEEEITLELITDHGQVINLLPENENNNPTTSGTDNSLTDEPYSTVHAISDTIVEYSRINNVPWIAPILLPPLEAQITLSEPFRKIEVGGWDGKQWLPPGRNHDGNLILPGSAPVGVLDDIYNRTQHPLWIHFNTGEQEHSNRKDGHMLILGSPGMGKTMFLRTLTMSQALLHSPNKMHMYFLSFTGGGLNSLGQLPHAESVVHGTEQERVRRLFGRLIHILDDRQAGRAEGIQPIIMLCIDQYEQFRDAYFEQHMHDFERLIYEGRAIGIYLVITASSVAAIPERLRSLIQQRIAFQLGTSSDYLLAVGHINTRVERALPRGRAYIYNSPPLICQISLPCIKQVISDDDTHEAMVELINQMRGGYLATQDINERDALQEHLQSPAPINELPSQIPLSTLPIAQYADETRITTTLGRYDDDSLSLFTLDWEESGPHFIVTGPPGSGKTNMLHTAVLSAAQHYPPKSLRFLLVDFNGRSLRPLAGLKHVIRHVTDIIDLQAQLMNLHNEMNVFYAQWRDDSTKTIPRTIIVFDDYDAVSETLSGNNNLLRQLRDHVRLHSELGLHIWVAGYLERIGDPLIKQLLLKRSGLGFSVRDSLHNLNVRVTDLPGDVMPAGRAYFAEHNTIRVVQTALVENPKLTVNRINAQVWTDRDRSSWENPVGQKELLEEYKQDTTDSDQGDDFALDIDTEGLIQDLLGGNFDE